MQIVFLGTPEFAVPTLDRLAAQPGWTVTAVITQPDRPAGRGGAVQAPAVRRAAERLGLAVYQPERIRDASALAWLRAQQPDVLVVVAFGQLLPPAVFELPRWGAINAHASLLPAYRGAAPIQWAIANGETRTGVTTMRINAGLDTGDILLQRAMAIAPEVTAPELAAGLSSLAAELMVETLAGLAAGSLLARPQPEGASLAPLLTRDAGRVNWDEPAQRIYDRWRGFQPWPGIYTMWRKKKLAILRCRPEPGRAPVEATWTGEGAGGAFTEPSGRALPPSALRPQSDPRGPQGACALGCEQREGVQRRAAAPPPPGLLLEQSGAVVAACGQGWLRLERVQVEGRRELEAEAFARGAHLVAGQEWLG